MLDNRLGRGGLRQTPDGIGEKFPRSRFTGGGMALAVLARHSEEAHGAGLVGTDAIVGAEWAGFHLGEGEKDVAGDEVLVLDGDEMGALDEQIVFDGVVGEGYYGLLLLVVVVFNDGWGYDGWSDRRGRHDGGRCGFGRKRFADRTVVITGNTVRRWSILHRIPFQRLVRRNSKRFTWQFHNRRRLKSNPSLRINKSRIPRTALPILLTSHTSTG